MEICTEEPLCSIEWVNLAEVMNHSKGLSWFQVLPVQQKSSLALQFNNIHILPEANIPYQLPIEIFLKNFDSNERKIERRNIKSGEKLVDDVRHKFELNAKA